MAVTDRHVKMGFEGRIFYGAAGSTASTLIENTKDANYDMDKEAGNTTVRGDGSVVPIDTEDMTARKFTIGWTMINDTTDTALAALLTAAYSAEGVAIRTKDHASGKGYDGDCILTVKNGQPLKGEQTMEFTATPSRSYGRAPLGYV